MAPSVVPESSGPQPVAAVPAAKPVKAVNPPASMSHIVFDTTQANFGPMKTFWQQFLNARLQWENHMLAFLTYDEEHHRVAIFAAPGTKDAVPHTAKMAHVAFTFNSMQDLLDSWKARKQFGIEPTWCVNHGPTTSIYYTDPDGNEIESQCWNFATPQEINDFLETPEYLENPIGVDFDPEEYLQRLAAGESEAVLTKRPNIGPRLTP